MSHIWITKLQESSEMSKTEANHTISMVKNIQVKEFWFFCSVEIQIVCWCWEIITGEKGTKFISNFQSSWNTILLCVPTSKTRFRSALFIVLTCSHSGTTSTFILIKWRHAFEKTILFLFSYWIQKEIERWLWILQN